jgi:hypothetical protein
MVELIGDNLQFSFPEVHPDARLTVTFQRTLRIPDNAKTYPLPPGLGAFPMRHVDDFPKTTPREWLEHGGVMLPMYQSEAVWIRFESERIPANRVRYPFAVKIAAGKINAVTGESWKNDLNRTPQDYAVVPPQPWIDGFAVANGVIRQFVAMPLGSGYSAEEQITGAAEHGGLQILVYPMRRDAFDARFPRRERGGFIGSGMMDTGAHEISMLSSDTAPMGLAPGGRMKQEIYRDLYGLDTWNSDERGRCFVHLLNSLMWEAVTDSKPPYPPVTAEQYGSHKLPWFDYYADGETALDGGAALKRLKSIIELARLKGDVPLPANSDVPAEPVIVLGKRSANAVRDGRF